MEDKNPFTPPEAQFSVPEAATEHDQKPDKKEKKKKSRLSEWLSKFVRPDVDDDTSPDAEEKREKTWRVAKAFRDLFDRVSGVETKELPEDPADSEQVLSTERSLYFPLTTEFSPEPVADQTDEGVGSEKSDAQQHYEYAVSHAKKSEHVEGVVDEPIDEDKTAAYVQDALAVTRTNEANVVAEQPGFYEQRREVVEKPEKEKEVIIERGGGGGAALLGFVAAETLSRSRDAKIRHEAEALKKQVDALEKNQVQQVTELHEVRDKNRQQIDALRERRRGPEQERDRGTERKTLERAPERPEPAKVVIEQTSRTPEAKLSTKRRMERREPIVPSRIETTPEVAPHHKNDRLVLEQVEKAAEQDIAIESFYERRHEAKDVPSSPQLSPSLASVGGGASSNQAPPASVGLHADDNAPVFAPPSRPSDLYTQAAKQGVYVGLAVIVGFLVVVFIWGLR